MIFIIGIALIFILSVVASNTYQRECIILKLTPNRTFTLIFFIGSVTGILLTVLIFKIIGD